MKLQGVIGFAAAVEAAHPGRGVFTGTRSERRRFAAAVKDIRGERGMAVVLPVSARPRERRRRSARSSAKSGDSGSDSDPPSRPRGRAAFAWFDVLGARRS